MQGEEGGDVQGGGGGREGGEMCVQGGGRRYVHGYDYNRQPLAISCHKKISLRHKLIIIATLRIQISLQCPQIIRCYLNTFLF